MIRLRGSGPLSATLLFLILGGAGLAYGPPHTSLESLEALNDAGLREVPQGEVLWLEYSALEHETVADYQELYENDEWRSGARFASLRPAEPATQAFHLGRPLYVGSLFDRDDPIPESARINRWLTDLATGTLQDWGITRDDAAYPRWLEAIKLWYWRSALVFSGPAYLVPVLDRNGDCIAVKQTFAWSLPGGASGSVSACPNRWPYLHREDARRLLESEGYVVSGRLRPLRHLYENLPYTVPSNCLEQLDRLSGGENVWTDGIYAVDVEYGTVYRVEPKLAENVVHAWPPAEPQGGRYELSGPWATMSPPYSIRPLSCPKKIEARPVEPALIPEEPPQQLSDTPPILIEPGRLREISQDQFLEQVGETWKGGPTIEDVRQVVSDSEKLMLLKAFDAQASALDVLELSPPVRVDSLLALPETPPRSAVLELLMGAAVKGRQRLYSYLGAQIDPDLARRRIWTQLRVTNGPEYLATLSDPGSGTCIAVLAGPVLSLPESFGSSLGPCPTNQGLLSAEEAFVRLRPWRQAPAGELRLVRLPTRSGAVEKCDPPRVDGPFWSDGRHAVHALSGNVYAISPAGGNWIERPPPPYFLAGEATIDDRSFTFLSAYLPLELRPLDCVPPAPPGPRPAAP